MKRDKRGLGRGLSALMADMPQTDGTGGASSVRSRADRTLPIDVVSANPDQPRRQFTESDLEDLSRSIREKGIIQPLIVRPDPSTEGRFQIVAGERRWRAAQRAQLHEVPVVIRDFDDTEVLEIAIIENIQRADLNAVEEAAGYRQLMDRFGHTQDKLAQALGKSRSHIANMLRLLNLPEDVQTLLQSGQLSAGHARALITSDNASELAKQVVARGLSVRETEKLAAAVSKGPSEERTKSTKPAKDADTIELEQSLSANLKMPVTIDHDASSGKGRVTVQYDDLGKLDDLVMKLGGG